MTRQRCSRNTGSPPTAPLAGQLIALGIATMMAACTIGSGTPTPPAPFGEYECYGHEAGLLAHTGSLRLDPDGAVEFLGRTGEWTYDAEADALAFTGDTPLLRAEYAADQALLRVELQPDVDIPHAELGTMTCYPRAE